MAAQGFKSVGKDFPVFLHPVTHEEYALARTERKSGRGYKGFTVQASPDVTLEDDLRRRDLTINAMAKSEDGTLIDPFGGKRDLQNRVLRHVSEAFAEDPVRILRVARFAARFGFRVHEKTMELMRRMVASGEADYLVPERVWQEFSKGLAEEHAERMFEVLDKCSLRKKLLPELKQWKRKLSSSVPVRFAALCWELKKAQVEALCKRLRVPNEVHDLAVVASSNRDRMKNVRTPKQLLDLLKRTDAFRRPARFAQLTEVAHLADPKINIALVGSAQAAAAAVDASSIAAKASSKAEIPKLLDAARIRAIAQAV